MPRLTIALIATVALLAGGLATSIYLRPTPGLADADVRAIVSEMLSAEAAKTAEEPVEVAEVDPATINPMIESYLLSNPRILERVSNALQADIRAEEIEQARVAIASMQQEIYDDPDHVVLGNPDGDVTLVELFDYNCGYCRSAVPDMAALIDSDPNLRVILKEFPILSQESVDAARVAVAAQKAGIDYWAFHTSLFTGRGKVTKQAALDAAEALGLNPVTLELEAQSDAVSAVIQRSYAIAQAIGTSGTPTYIIGDEVIPGAIGADALRERIENLRECGSTVCEG